MYDGFIVIQDLDFYVMGMLNQFFQIDFVFVECCFGFVFGCQYFFFKCFFIWNDVYVMVIVVLGCFQYYWVVDFQCKFFDFVEVIGQWVGCWYYWNVGFNCQILGSYFVVEVVYGF